MKQISFLTAVVLLATASMAQEGRTPKRVTLKLAIKDSIQRVDYGYLAAMGDSGIVMLRSPVVFDHSLANTNANLIPYQNLSEVSIKRKGNVGRGILIGTISGIIVGGITGYITYKKPDCKDALICWDFGPSTDAAAGASLGAVGGAIIGGIVGALAKKTFIIGGKKEKFHEMKTSVMDMTYRNK
jgi:hypothetical protein